MKILYYYYYLYFKKIEDNSPELSAFHLLTAICWLPTMPVVDYFFTKYYEGNCEYLDYIVQAFTLLIIGVVLHFTLRRKAYEIIQTKPTLFNNDSLSKVFAIASVILSFCVLLVFAIYVLK